MGTGSGPAPQESVSQNGKCRPFVSAVRKHGMHATSALLLSEASFLHEHQLSFIVIMEGMAWET